MSSLRLLIVLLAVLAGSTLALPTGYGSYEAPAPTLGLEQPAQPVSIESTTAWYNAIPTESLDEPTTASYGSVTEQQQLFDVPSTTAASGYHRIELDRPIVTDAYAPATTQALDEPTTTIAASYGPSSTLTLDVPTTTTAAPAYEQPSVTESYAPAPTQAVDETTTASYGPASAIALDIPTTTAGYAVKSDYEALITTIEAPMIAPLVQDTVVKSEYSSYQPVPTIAQDVPTTTTAAPMTTASYGYTAQPTSSKASGYVLNHDAARAYWATATFPPTTATASLTTASLPTVAPAAQDSVVKANPYQANLKSGY